MKKKQPITKYFILLCGFLVGLLLLIKYFNLSWVEMDEGEAKVTINFLLPMDQESFKSKIQVVSERNDATKFEYQLNWLSPQVVEIRLRENNDIQGLKVKLIIQDAATQIKGLYKSEKVNIQFNVPIVVNEANTKKLISSTETFVISFNTPVRIKDIEKYMSSEAAFYITPYENSQQDNGKSDPTRFVLVPKEPLENGKCYVLTIKSGLRALSGNILSQDIHMYLQVDEKPTIIETYPAADDKWIGLYPKITFSTDKPIVAAIAKLNGKTLSGKLIDDKHGYFMVNNLLEPMSQYTLQIQAKAASGELSEVKEVTFSTTSLNDNRGWLEICCGDKKCINYYEGQKKVKTIVCAIGNQISASDYGTYYLQSKSDVYEDYSANEGANYLMTINEKINIHGYTRSSDWKIDEVKRQEIGGKTKGKQIVISDEDAQWLYDKLANQTMIIIRN